MDYEQAQPVIDSSVLNAKRPWYSAKYGDNIKAGATTPWGNTQTDPYGAAEQAGSKQYELTNHLGNVQTTVGDNRYAVADESTDTIKAFHPVIKSAYDYYPFGMLMPGRYVSDTSEHCVTISRPTWAWKEVTVACWDVYSWRWPGYTPINKGTAVVSGDAVEINAPAAGDGVSFDFPVTANVQQELDIDVERVNLNNKASVQIMELEGADWVTLAEAPINVVSGGISIPFTPKANTVRVIWNGPIVIWVRKHCISKLEWVEEDQLVTVCDEDKDKYRWGFNGKEKINEWAGIGNYLDYGARGLDTRVGRFLSLDPLAKKYLNISPYAFVANNPIIFKDPEGNDIVYFSNNGEEVSRTVSNTKFETYVGSVGNWHQAPMPKIIKGYENQVYQKYDYNIAAHTFIFNTAKEVGLLNYHTPGGNLLPAEKQKTLPKLDPTLVKAIIIQETKGGTYNGLGNQKGKTDIMQANVSGDWGGGWKKQFGLTQGGSTKDPNQSVKAGIGELYIKGLKTSAIKDSKGNIIGYEINWTGGDDWEKAAQKYNGGGAAKYGQTYDIQDKVDNAQTPKPSNYTDKKK